MCVCVWGTPLPCTAREMDAAVTCCLCVCVWLCSLEKIWPWVFGLAFRLRERKRKQPADKSDTARFSECVRVKLSAVCNSVSVSVFASVYICARSESECILYISKFGLCVCENEQCFRDLRDTVVSTEGNWSQETVSLVKKETDKKRRNREKM